MPATSVDAMEIRKQWMREMGYGEDEIAELCDPQKFPAEIKEELENLEAAHRLKKRGIRDVLKEIGKSI